MFILIQQNNKEINTDALLLTNYKLYSNFNNFPTNVEEILLLVLHLIHDHTLHLVVKSL